MNSSAPQPEKKPRRHLQRLLLLLASIGTGLVVSLLGFHLTANQAWFLAIPGAVALAWLFVANPEECCGGASVCRRDDSAQR